MYANGGYSCAVAIPRNPGVKLQMGVFTTVNGGTQVSDYGLYSQYAGPVTIYAKGTCVQFGGRIGMVGTEIEWGHCGWTPTAVTPR
ncbi:hypothetical protein OG379_19810 [Streptomyces sp. NBC_01166]|uniref:hypothetical protein n=1 Tax=Streptomyces sp. NBC_01166 TaxID=2903755 RepID=UPI00386A23B5|nr:hypothetical protein OG379_19810 [Streptomyces sp. NBC_01166]